MFGAKLLKDGDSSRIPEFVELGVPADLPGARASLASRIERLTAEPEAGTLASGVKWAERDINGFTRALRGKSAAVSMAHSCVFALAVRFGDNALNFTLAMDAIARGLPDWQIPASPFEPHRAQELYAGEVDLEPSEIEVVRAWFLASVPLWREVTQRHAQASPETYPRLAEAGSASPASVFMLEMIASGTAFCELRFNAVDLGLDDPASLQATPRSDPVRYASLCYLAADMRLDELVMQLNQARMAEKLPAGWVARRRPSA